MTIELKPVIGSSNIAAEGYDKETQELQLEFKGGGLYAYDGVPQEVYDALVGARSVGKEFHAKIRDQYKTRKLK